MYLELLATARRSIALRDGKHASRTDLRRAVGTAYYALFHFIAQACTDVFLPRGKKLLSRANMQAYRSIDHRDIRNACILTKDVKYGSPQGIRRFADIFLSMNKLRERADYDPSPISDFHPNQVSHLIDACESGIEKFASADIEDRRAFAVQVCLKSKARA
jgi:hypothetical protein